MPEANYRLTKANAGCSRCESEFGGGEVYVSVLKEDAGDLFTREDFCLRCWDACEDEYFSFWRTRRRVEGSELKVDEDAVLPFFLSLGDRDDREALELRYVLSLYLARRKKLKLIDVRGSGGGEELVFEGPEKGEMTRVTDPGLSEDRIGELTETIYALFSDQR